MHNLFILVLASLTASPIDSSEKYIGASCTVRGITGTCETTTICDSLGKISGYNACKGRKSIRCCIDVINKPSTQPSREPNIPPAAVEPATGNPTTGELKVPHGESKPPVAEEPIQPITPPNAGEPKPPVTEKPIQPNTPPSFEPGTGQPTTGVHLMLVNLNLL